MPSRLISNFAISAILTVGHFEFCAKMLYFKNAWTDCYETWYGSSARCPEGAWEVSKQRHLVVKSYNNISKKANNLWINLPIEMPLVLIDSLGHAENIDTKFAKFGRTSCPPSWFSVKTYFFELLLDRLSDFHQNRIVSSPHCTDKKLWNSCWFVKPFSNTAQTNFTLCYSYRFSAKVLNRP